MSVDKSPNDLSLLDDLIFFILRSPFIRSAFVPVTNGIHSVDANFLPRLSPLNRSPPPDHGWLQ
ncbi:hypothetical protein HDZ31DRAFT_70043 [Schizophyllum fasciatum]